MKFMKIYILILIIRNTLMLRKVYTYIIDFQGEPIVTKFEFLKVLQLQEFMGLKV